MVGNRIGPYKFVREIGEDALGQIFQAKDISSKKLVTIRALRREAATSPETVARLYSEAKTLALLNHPHIARIFGFIRHNEQLFLVMEFVEGETLQSILKAKRRLDPAVTLAYFHQIFSAVAFAHKLGEYRRNQLWSHQSSGFCDRPDSRRCRGDGCACGHGPLHVSGTNPARADR
jgi:serine/threonine protein kinase